MIRGLDTFREYFKDYKEQYVLIGGAACDIVLEPTLVDARATKDFDIVLIVEAITPEFGRRIWSFIRDGGYKHKAKSTGAPQYYRFDEPADSRFPFMIELLSRNENVIPDEKQGIIPLPIGESISSLSAILLNHDYYKLLFVGRETIDDIVILTPQYLIPFKAKAWLDLTDRKNRGEHVNTRDIRKHASDVVRLAAILSNDLHIDLPESVLVDMTEFVTRFEANPIEPRSMGLKDIQARDIIARIRSVYTIR
jgi:hypothetical protein